MSENNQEILFLRQELLNKLDKNEDILEKLRSEIGQQNVKIAKFEMLIDKQQSSIDDLEKQLMINEARVEVLEKALAALDKQLVQTTNDMDKKAESQKSFINGLLWVFGAFAAVSSVVMTLIKFKLVD